MVTKKEGPRRLDKQKQLVGRATISSNEDDCYPDSTQQQGGHSLELLLRRLSGEEDLKVMRTLAFRVDTSVTQVDHLGVLMPSLAELRFERGSTLSSFRDLGSSLSQLRVLWLSACGVRHLDGVGALTGLEELYLAFNHVDDLTSIALHDRLQVLDLESNNIEDVDQATHLGTCPCLWSLTLVANPVSRRIGKHYRRYVVEAVPHLISLDEKDVTGDDRIPPPPPGHECEGVVLPKPSVQESPLLHDFSSNGETPPPWTQWEDQEDFQELDILSSAVDVPRGFDAVGMRATAMSCRGGARIVAADTESAVERSLSFKVAGELAGRREQLDRAFTIAAAGNVKTTPDEDIDSDTPHAAALNSDLLVNDIPPTCPGDSYDDRVSYGNNAGRAHRGISVGEATCGAGKERSMTTSGRDADDFGDDPVPPVIDEERLVSEVIKGFRCLATSKALRWSTDDRELDDVRRIGGERNFDLSDGSIADEDGSLASLEEMGDVLSGGGRGRGCQEKTAGHVYEENKCLLKVLRLPGITPAGGGNYQTSPGITNASSTLTHGSEMTIAGNPSFGLRRRHRHRHRHLHPPDRPATATAAFRWSSKESAPKQRPIQI